MCLAKVFVEDPEGEDTQLVLENTTKAFVDGDTIRVTSLLGEAQEIQGRIESIDFVDGRLLVRRLP